MIDPTHTYDYLVETRAYVLDAAKQLAHDQYHQPFPIGLGSLAKIITHTFVAERYYTYRITEADMPPYNTWPIQEEQPPAPADLESAWSALAKETRQALADVTDWDKTIEFRVDPEHGEPRIVTTTPSGILTQIIIHETHHRAQAVNILKQLGSPVRDLDYNDFRWQRRPANA